MPLRPSASRLCAAAFAGALALAVPAAVLAQTPDGASATPAPAAAAKPVFPAAVGAKYASEKPGRARLHTCRDQYRANKAGAGNGGLSWIQKGGGYFSQCSRSLKKSG